MECDLSFGSTQDPKHIVLLYNDREVKLRCFYGCDFN